MGKLFLSEDGKYFRLYRSYYLCQMQICPFGTNTAPDDTETNGRGSVPIKLIKRAGGSQICLTVVVLQPEAKQFVVG